MTTEAIVNLTAILMSPVIAVCVTLWYQGRADRHKARQSVFTTLVANRHRPISDDNVGALHLIDAVFHDCKSVRSIWHRYFDSLHSSDGADASYMKRQQLYRDLLIEMARTLGYRSTIESGDIERIYTPVGLGERDQCNRETSEELLRVLKNSEYIGGHRKRSDELPSSEVERLPQKKPVEEYNP